MPNFELICGDCITEIERLAESGRLADSLKTYEYGFKDTLRKVEESLLF